MSPADVETLREDAARANDGWVRADDVRALLAHVDALQAQIDAARAVVDATAGDARWTAAQALRLRLRIQQHAARHLLAWQQARILPILAEPSRYSTTLETISAMGCDGDGDGDTCSCAPCRADEALTGSEELSEIAARDNEITRLTSERDSLERSLRMYRTAWDRELRDAGAAIPSKASGVIDGLVAGTKDLGAQISTLRAERDAARAEVEMLKQQISDEQDLAAQCQALCGECRGLCGGEAALSEREVAS